MKANSATPRKAVKPVRPPKYQERNISEHAAIVKDEKKRRAAFLPLMVLKNFLRKLRSISCRIISLFMSSCSMTLPRSFSRLTLSLSFSSMAVSFSSISAASSAFRCSVSSNCF